jgi:hypothetical protein
MPLSYAAPAFPRSSLTGSDYCVIEDGKVIGRIYEEGYTPPDLRWFWSITAFLFHPSLR